MFDATALYPEGFHPYEQHMKRSGFGIVRDYLNRTDVLPSVRYYFTDFGISTHFKDPSQPHLVTGIHGQDQEVPELSDTVPYNPFKTDVYILGDVYKTCLTDVYSNLSFLEPLAQEMTKSGPRSRPSAEESLSHFHNLLRQQRKTSLRWMLLEPDIKRPERIRRHLRSLAREIRRFAKNLYGWPASLVLLASITAATFVYGPRDIISRVRETFQRRP